MNYITITGIQHYFGNDVFRPHQTLYLEKDMENDKDDEAIRVVNEAGVTYGYVANSVYTVARGCRSAGRIYDTFTSRVAIHVMFVLDHTVIARIEDCKSTQEQL